MPDHELRELLVQGLMGGGDVRQLLEQRAAADPRLQLILEMMARREQLAEQAEPEPAAAPASAERRRRVLERFRAMQAELEELRDGMAELVAALGACELCFGRDPHCQVCRGRGGPGWRQPETDLYEELVAPAVRRMQASNTRGG